MAPKVVVHGGTGTQGGGVVRDLLAKGGFDIVVPTRKPDSEKAEALRKQGVAIVECDQHNKEQVAAAYEGADYVFAVTNFWEPSGMGKEFELGKTMADAAKAAGVKLFMWSSLPDVEGITDGKHPVPHFTDKAKVDAYIKSIDLPAVFLGAAFYYSNLRYFFPPQKAEDGTLEFNIPATPGLKIASFDPTDMGKAVVMVLEDADKFKGQWIPVVGENKTMPELVQEFTEVTGKPARHVAVPMDAFKKLGFPGAEELGCMFEYFEEHGYFGPHDLSKSPKNCTGFKDWLKASGWTGEA
eukprot:m.4729 g.4729  ORF g.4729 m.4729 type:complete len:297 (+) comp7159_c0_seq1:149-1039(+)